MTEDDVDLPRTLVDLADLKALLMLADEAIELSQMAPYRFQNEALLARVAGKAGIDGYEVDT